MDVRYSETVKEKGKYDVMEYGDLYIIPNEDKVLGDCFHKKVTFGHLVVKSVDSSGILIFYLPEYISDNQSMWMFEHGNLFQKYSMVGGYQIKKVDDTYRAEELEGMNRIAQRINRNNILYHKAKQEQKNGRGI